MKRIAFADAANSETGGKNLLKVWNNDSDITISQIFLNYYAKRPKRETHLVHSY